MGKALERYRPLARIGLCGVALCCGLSFNIANVSTAALAQTAAAEQSAPGAELQPLTIDTASGRHAFRVELAQTDAERERGLMYRRNLPQDRGMIFDFKDPQPVMMWMKNTYIPLDMIFIARDGKVTHVAEDAEPLSEKIIPSGGPVYAVLEVSGGTAQRINLKVGDRVEHAMFRH